MNTTEWMSECCGAPMVGGFCDDCREKCNGVEVCDGCAEEVDNCTCSRDAELLITR